MYRQLKQLCLMSAIDLLPHRALPVRQALLEHGFVGRLDLAPHQMLDYFPTLVHAELDEIAAAGGAYSVRRSEAQVAAALARAVARGQRGL